MILHVVLDYYVSMHTKGPTYIVTLLEESTKRLLMCPTEILLIIKAELGLEKTTI